MPKRWLSLTIPVLCALILSGGCADDPVSPSAVVVDDAAFSAAVMISSTSGAAYHCDLYSKDASGEFRHRAVSLEFKKPELHTAGAMRQYRYMGYSGKEQVRVGICQIPATRKAVRRVDRLFNLGNRPDWAFGNSITTMSCPPQNSQACYDLGEVTVTACPGGRGSYPKCEEMLPEEFEQCDWWNPCGSTGGADGGGAPSDNGGGGTAPPSEPCWNCQPGPDTPCESGDPIIDSPGVNEALQDLWSRSKADGLMDQRLEQAAWIIFNNGQYSAVPMLTNSTACSADPQEPPPSGAVGYIHTHPYDWGNNETCGLFYMGTLSQPDLDTMNKYGFQQAYILDAAGIGKATPSTGRATDRMSRCMY